MKNKVTVIGAGGVGAVTAYSLLASEAASEVVLIDINTDKALGEALDIKQATPFLGNCDVYAGDYRDAEGSQFVIIAGGIGRKPGQTRLELVKTNVEIIKSIAGEIVKYAPDAMYIIISNPVDVLTYAFLKFTGLPKNQVLGSGTVLDTARLKYLISKKTGIDARNCHTYIIGEHGDSEVAAWSITNIGGMSMHEFCRCTGKCNINDLSEMYEDVKNAAYEIIKNSLK